MPVGTAATVKGQTQQDLENLGAQILLGNTYHLYLRPGHELIRAMGGLHKFMSWPHPILTDSGGFQVFSLSDLRKVTTRASRSARISMAPSIFFRPKKRSKSKSRSARTSSWCSTNASKRPRTNPRTRDAAARTLDWARRSRDYFAAHGDRDEASAFRHRARRHARRAAPRKCPRARRSGFSRVRESAGLAVGESHELTCEMTQVVNVAASGGQAALSDGRRQARADSRLRGLGIDMMDCVLPTRSARHGCLFTSEGRLIIRNAQYARDPRPIDENCGCAVCRRYSRAYLRHLYSTGEFLATILNTHHNLYFYLDMMGKIREAIRFGKLERFRSDLQARLT